MRAASLTRREQRTVSIGLIVSAIALFTAFVAMPYQRRWSAREELIASRADRIAKLESLISAESGLRETLRGREIAESGPRLVSGRTAALAASSLQGAIQGYATRSRVTIDRLDLAGAPDSVASPLPAIPASLSATGDVYGISEFLSLLQYGSPVVEIRQMTLVSNSSLRGGLIQLSLTLSAPSVIE